MKKYKTDFLPLWLHAGYCSLTVVLWLLNYFFDSNFAAKDNFDVFWLVKWGRRWRGDLLSLDEIALFCDRLYLDVTHFSGVSKADAKRYWEWDTQIKIEVVKKYTDPKYHRFIQWERRVFENGNSIDIIDALLEKRIWASSIKYENEYSDAELVAAIKSHQNLENGGVIFVLGLSYNILYDVEKTSEDGEGHVVISTGINLDNQFIIYEPIRPRPNPHFIPVDQVLRAMHDAGVYSFLMIKDNPDHIYTS